MSFMPSLAPLTSKNPRSKTARTARLAWNVDLNKLKKEKHWNIHVVHFHATVYKRF